MHTTLARLLGEAPTRGNVHCSSVERHVCKASAVGRLSGTVTIVFSDIENSTRRAVELGDVAWMEVLKVHNAIVRRQVARFRGTEVKSQGDGFMLTFSSARAALDAMIETQRALHTWARFQPADAVRVRVGVHTGEVIRERDDVFGKHVMLAARVANAARGGEILSPCSTRGLRWPWAGHASVGSWPRCWSPRAVSCQLIGSSRRYAATNTNRPMELRAR